MISDEQKAEMRLNFSEFNPIFVSAFSKIWFEELKEEMLKNI
jgi:hypothetical protein